MGLPVGSIVAFGITDFVPLGYYPCEGQSVPRAGNEELFNVIGYNYGPLKSGASFNLPDMRGIRAVGAGNVAGKVINVGDAGGGDTMTVTVDMMPAHTHAANVAMQYGAAPTSNSPQNNFPAISNTKTATDKIYSSPKGAGFLAASTETIIPVAATGGDNPLNVQGPYLATRFGIKATSRYPG